MNQSPQTDSLRVALVANAVFSFASGLLLLVAPGTVGGWLGVTIDGWLRLAGLVLLGHGALIVALLPRMQLQKIARLNLLAIAPYPILMIVLVATGMISRTLGQVLALVDGAAIAAIAAVLARGLRGPTLTRQAQHA